MKDQIVELDSTDDWVTVRDQMMFAQADRIVLVWPPADEDGRVVLGRRLDLVLVQRHARRVGARLGIVCDDPEVGDFARTLGIPVFETVEGSRLFAWPKLREKPVRRPGDYVPVRDPEVDDPIFEPAWPAWLTSPAVRLAGSGLVFAVALGAVLAMLALVAPTATVTLVPAGEQLSVRVGLLADPALSEEDEMDAGHVPAETRTVVVRDSITINTTGTVGEATQRAGGFVTFTNQTAQSVRVPAGTTVRTSTGINPQRFVTQADIDLAGEVGATADAPVLAVEPGPRGNVGPALINRIEGPLNVAVAVVNQQALSGGEVVDVAAVTEADRTQARDLLEAQLLARAYAQLEAGLAAYEFAPQDSLRVIAVRDTAYSDAIGDTSDTLTLDMSLEAGVTVVDERLADDLARAELARVVPPGLVLRPNTVTVEVRRASVVDEDYRVSFQATASGDATTDIDGGAVRATLRWQEPDAARNVVSALPLARPAVIEVTPAWFPRLPWLAENIAVVVVR